MGLREPAAPLLVAFGGLPGAGKTTLARALARRLGAAYLRIDAVEQAVRDAGLPSEGPVGYGVAQALALSNLENGLPVVADCVNPVAASRAGWRAAAARAGARLLEVVVVCSDPAEHRRRVETRASDIPGLEPPRWAAVEALVFAPWPEAHLVVDTALGPAERGVDAILAAVESGAAVRPASAEAPPAF